MKSFEKFFNTSIMRMKRENQQIFLFTFLIGLVNTFYYIIYPISYSKKLSIQGPFLVLIETLHGGWNHPILLLLSFFFLAISIIILKDTFLIKKKFSIFLLTALITLFPVFHENSLFLSSYLGIVISFLLSTYSLLCLEKKKTILSIILMCTAFCLYPFSITIPLSGIFLLSIQDLFHNEYYFKKIIYYILTIVMGIIISQIVFQILSIIAAKNYSVHLHSFFSIFQNGFAFFFQNSILQNHSVYRDIIHLFLFVGLGIFLIKNSFYMKGDYKFHYITSLVLFFISISFSTIFSTQLDTCIGFIMIYILFFMIIEFQNTLPIFKTFIILGILILSYTYLISNQATYMVHKDQDVTMYAKLDHVLQKAKALEGYQENLAYFFSDPFYYDSSLNQMSNRDYSMELYDTHYYKEYFKDFFGEDISIASSSLTKEILASNDYKMMNPGDVQIIHNVIVFKISNSCYYKKY